jgi:hypothetical protein
MVKAAASLLTIIVEIVEWITYSLFKIDASVIVCAACPVICVEIF